MKINSYLTFLSRNKAYTAINVFGLSVSLMFVILIGLYYEHETGVDQQIPDKERVVLVHPAKTENFKMSGTSREIIPLLRKQLPQIQSACALFSMTNRHVQFAQDDYAKCDMLYVDSTYYDVFGFTLIQGDPHTALADEQSVVLEEGMARKLFPQGDAMGKPLTLNDKYKVFVRGIYRRTENSSIPQDDIVGRYELLREELPYYFKLMGNFGSPDVYLKLNEGTDYKELIPQVNKILTEAYAHFGLGIDELEFSLSPVAENYFSDYSSNVCRRGKPALVMLIAIIGLIILAFAVMNYINLTVAQAGRRAKEMATRRLLGSQKRDIMVRMVLESTALCAFSVALALVLTAAAVPYTNQLLETHIGLGQLAAPLNLLILLGGTAVLGAVAGLIPARLMATVQPIDVVRGTFRLKSKTTLGRAFMTVQHFITIVLVAVTAIFSHHTLHMIHAPLGYETDSLMAFRIQQNAQKAMLFKQKLKALPGVENASVCMNVPLNGGFNQMGETESGKTVRFQRLYGDEDYLATLGIELKEKWGNGEYMNTYVSTDFHSTLGITPGTRTFKWRPVDQELMDIHGMLADFSLGTSRHKEHSERPEVTIVYEIKNEVMDNSATGVILIRVRGDKKETLEAVKQIYKEVYREDFTDSMPWMQQSVAAAFQAESRLLTILSCFAGVALLISVLGLVAMSTYHIQQRRKEIAVRKVFGSSVAQVRRRLIGQFLAHVAVAALPAVPLVWWLAREYMSTQVVRIVWWPWIIIAVAVVLLISWLAVAVQSRMAAAEKPVKHIKDNE